MATWREHTSATAQADLDGLLDAALGMAEHTLAERGAFHPFGLVVDRDGRTEVIAVESGPAQLAQEHAYQAIAARRKEIRAAAVVTDVSLPETGGDAIDVQLEHAEGTALSVLEPYRIVDGDVRPEPLEAHSEQRRIWA